VVIGGNYVVGVVVFLIIMVIQFVVITNGAGRVAEVAARFTLDAMPGKQMAIDADLNAGMINDVEARRRRKAIEQEADFYGAMDGASKFVRGDSVAGILIVIVNILGGFAVGVLQQGMSISDALQNYTTLTVGDGLVTQIPALLISTASGIMVTRAASESNLGRDVARDVLGNPRALIIAAVVVGALGLMPGMPKLPFLVIAGAVGGTAYYLTKQPTAPPPPPPAPPEPARGPEAVLDLLQLDPMELEIGYSLIPLVDAEQGGSLLNRITMIRRQLALDLGIVLPTVRVRDNLQLRPNGYVIKIRGVEIVRGELLMNHFLAMNPGTAEGKLEGVPTTEPAFGLPATWIAAAAKERAEVLGYTVVDPGSVLTTHLTEVIKQHAPSILGRQDTQVLLNNAKKDHPALIDELVPGQLTVGEIQKVLQNLLRDRVSVRDLVTILETLADYARTTRDPDLLTDYVRRALARSITAQIKDERNVVHALMLNPQLEQALVGSLQPTEQGLTISVEPARLQRVIQRLAQEMERMAAAGHQPVILCSTRVRGPFRRVTERSLPNLMVLSFGEVSAQVNVQSFAVVGEDE